MAVRDDIRQALYDAIGWQSGLADAWPAGSPERQEAVDQIKKYRAVLKRRYGEARHPSQKVLDGAKAMTLDEIRAMHEPNNDPMPCGRDSCAYAPPCGRPHCLAKQTGR